MFRDGKVAQMAAYLLDKAGGSMNILKLMKLLYLADREAFSRFGYSLSEDQMVSMPQGPVLSKTLDLINGYQVPGVEHWDSWIEDRENHEVRLRRPFRMEDANLLSRDATETLRSVWADFGRLNQWELVKYTHDNCAEWSDPNGSSKQISSLKVFAALGKDAHVAKALDEELQNQKRFDDLFGSERWDNAQIQHA